MIGLDKIRTLYSRQLYDDLFTMALCEEFTLYLCLACHISHLRPQQKIWYLLRRTSGWGRALALALADFEARAAASGVASGQDASPSIRTVSNGPREAPLSID